MRISSLLRPLAIAMRPWGTTRVSKEQKLKMGGKLHSDNPPYF